MKVALLGDIHGNSLALENVLKEAEHTGVERLLITGDLVGYYFEPHRVLQLLDPWEKYLVRGNHEEMLKAAATDKRLLSEIEPRYGCGLSFALEQLSPEKIDWLSNLPHPLDIQLDECRILLCHGSPWDIDHYVYPDATPEIFSRCAVQDFDVVVLGHTHYPMLKTIGRTLVVNPGSIGQPRNRQPGAHWAILDTKTKHIEFKRQRYDYKSVATQAERLNPELPYLAQVLKRT